MATLNTIQRKLNMHRLTDVDSESACPCCVASDLLGWLFRDVSANELDLCVYVAMHYYELRDDFRSVCVN